MADISSIINSGAHIDTRNKSQQSPDAGFDALLNAASTKASSDSESLGEALNGLVNGLIENISGSRSSDQAFGPAPKYPFSALFESTFGLSGPLPTYITLITSKLNLTAAQNQSLQDISIRNKDIVKTPESVRLLALELKAAGLPPSPPQTA